jgi:hypothetical protein
MIHCCAQISFNSYLDFLTFKEDKRKRKEKEEIKRRKEDRRKRRNKYKK